MCKSAIPWTVAYQAPLSMGFSGHECWSGLPCPPPGDLPNTGIEPRSPTLQVDSLPAEPPGKPKNTGVGSLSLLQRISMTQESNQYLLHCKQILYQLSYQESHLLCQYLTTLCSPCCEEAQARKAEEAVEERCPIILPLDHCSQPR